MTTHTQRLDNYMALRDGLAAHWELIGADQAAISARVLEWERTHPEPMDEATYRAGVAMLTTLLQEFNA